MTQLLTYKESTKFSFVQYFIAIKQQLTVNNRVACADLLRPHITSHFAATGRILQPQCSMLIGRPALGIETPLTRVKAQDCLVTIATHLRHVPSSVRDVYFSKTNDAVIATEIVAELKSTVHDLISKYN